MSNQSGQQRPPRKFVPHPFSYHQEVELDITSLTNMGQGIGRVDGWVVMVPLALPDEKVIARIYRNDKNFSEADLVSVVEPSPDRVEPRCPLFGQCGGCQYQNFSYAGQLTWKRQQVADLLRHQSKLEFPVEAVIPSPQQYGYRSKITPHFEAPHEGIIREIGFLRRGMRRELVDVARCEIATEAINAALPAVREGIRKRAGAFKKGATLLLRDVSGQVFTDHKAIAKERVCGVEMEFLAGDFFQNNPFILDQFVQYAVDEARASGATHLVDAYCGSGLFGLVAAKSFTSVLGVEVAESAVVRARGNAALNGITNCTFVAAKAEEIFASATTRPCETALVIDPPRAGCDEAFIEQLISFGPRAVVYVSCNPATQMRDLQKLCGSGYLLKKVQPFDLFPQTKHLECVVTLHRA